MKSAAGKCFFAFSFFEGVGCDQKRSSFLHVIRLICVSADGCDFREKDEVVSTDHLSLMWFYSHEASEAKADCWEHSGKVSAEYLRV